MKQYLNNLMARKINIDLIQGMISFSLVYYLKGRVIDVSFFNYFI